MHQQGGFNAAQQLGLRVCVQVAVRDNLIAASPCNCFWCSVCQAAKQCRFFSCVLQCSPVQTSEMYATSTLLAVIRTVYLMLAMLYNVWLFFLQHAVQIQLITISMLITAAVMRQTDQLGSGAAQRTCMMMNASVLKFHHTGARLSRGQVAPSTSNEAH
jgi:hypothetical protein